MCYSNTEDGGREPNLGVQGPNDRDGDEILDVGYKAALNATCVLLLWDPNHITAANFRKKYLLLSSRSYLMTSLSSNAPISPAAPFLALLRSEFAFLNSLVTSPLPKAPKASTLWAHRLWLFRSFYADVLVLYQRGLVLDRAGQEIEVGKKEEGSRLNPEDPPAARKRTQTEEKAPKKSDDYTALRNLYTTELNIVMRAADRHSRNYHAWNYARSLFTLILTTTPPISPFILTLSALTQVHTWCMTHPRDISGWTFLIFLIQRLGDLSPLCNAARGENEGGGVGAGAEEEEEDGDMQILLQRKEARREVGRILCVTAEAKERFGWKGESVRLFLRVGGKGKGTIE